MMDPNTTHIVQQLLLAIVLGGLIGIERWVKRKPAGLRTYALVSLGACVFTLLPVLGFGDAHAPFDSRVVSEIVVGIGFLGAGLIFHREDLVQGLTTAAGLWVTAAIGAAVGLGLYTLATAATVFSLTIFLLLYVVEEKIPRNGDL